MKGRIVSAKAPLRGQDGAASVLVLLMLVVLVALGVLTLSSAMLGQRLSSKAEEWPIRFYKLDRQATERLAQVDQVLYQAEANARSYLKNGQYARPESDALPPEIQNALYQSWAENPDPGRLEALFARLYRYFSVSLLESVLNMDFFSLRYDGQEISSAFSGTDAGLSGPAPIVLFYSVSEHEDGREYGLNVMLEVRAPEYHFFAKNGQISGMRADAGQTRYGILRWQQWQPALNGENAAPAFSEGIAGAPDA